MGPSWGPVLLAAVVGLGCGAETPRPDRVVMVLVDTLRADRLGVYGYDRDTSPAIDSLARSGAVFHTARSTSSWTKPAVASLFTGVSPEVHGLEEGRVRDLRSERVESLRDELPTLAESFVAAGWTAGAWVSNPHVSAPTGLDRGFDPFVRGPLRGDGLVDRFLEWLDAQPPEAASGWFAYLHLMHPHLPYPKSEEGSELFPPRPELSRPVPADALQRLGRQRLRDTDDVADYEARYDAAVWAADRQVGRVVAGLEERGLGEGTLLIVLSDHGEELLEHGNLNHGRSLYEEVVRVPLVVAYPQAVEPGLEISQPVSLLDVHPTLTEWLDLPGGDIARPGRSLVGVLARGEGLPARPQRLTHVPLNGDERRRVDARIEGPWKLVSPVAGGAELYDLSRDPAEQDDLATIEPEIARRLAARLVPARRSRAGVAIEQAEHDVPEDLRRELEALGYVAGAADDSP